MYKHNIIFVNKGFRRCLCRSEVNLVSEAQPKKSNIKLTIFIVAIIVIIALIASWLIIYFFYQNNNSDKKYTASFVTTEVVKKMNYDGLSEISASNVKNYYPINEDIVDDCSMYISTHTDVFTEVACFRLRSKNDSEEMLDIIDRYIADKTSTYQNVNEKAVAVLNASRTDVLYPYVFVAITTDSTATINAFESIVST